MRPKIRTLLDRLNAGHYIIDVDWRGRAGMLQLCTKDYLQYVNDIWGAEGQYGSASQMKEQGYFMVTIDRYGNVIECIRISRPEHRSFILNVLGAKA